VDIARQLACLLSRDSANHATETAVACAYPSVAMPLPPLPVTVAALLLLLFAAVAAVAAAALKIRQRRTSASTAAYLRCAHDDDALARLPPPSSSPYALYRFYLTTAHQLAATHRVWHVTARIVTALLGGDAPCCRPPVALVHAWSRARDLARLRWSYAIATPDAVTAIAALVLHHRSIDSIIDIGAGTSYWTFLVAYELSQQVPGGAALVRAARG